jgi:hypothetical protein
VKVIQLTFEVACHEQLPEVRVIVTVEVPPIQVRELDPGLIV